MLRFRQKRSQSSENTQGCQQLLSGSGNILLSLNDVSWHELYIFSNFNLFSLQMVYPIRNLIWVRWKAACSVPLEIHYREKVHLYIREIGDIQLH